MTLSRGDGIGIEVTDRVMRVVRLRSDVAGRIDRAVDVDIADDGSGEQRLLDAFVRAARALGAVDLVPTRIGWFPAASTLQAFDLAAIESAAHRSDAQATVDGVDATLAVSGGGRHWLLALRWPIDEAEAMAELARRAGFHDPLVEPAPVSLSRIGPPEPFVVERETGDGHGWSCVVRDGVPVIAASGTSTTHGHRLAVLDDVTGLPSAVTRLEDVLAADQVDECLGAVRHAARGRAPNASPLADRRPPTNAWHEVALGASIAAAGLAGRNRVLRGDTPSPAAVTSDAALPWAIERLNDPPARDQRTSSWRTLIVAVRRWLTQRGFLRAG